MENTLSELVKISNALGKDKTLVLGGFGNTSIKTADGRSMYIKASGTELAGMTAVSGWRKLDLGVVHSIMADKSLARMEQAARQSRLSMGLLFACCDDISAPVRPSVESFFHAILDRCVVHLHPESVLAFACAKKGRAAIEKIFSGEKNPPVWIPYTNIGYPLAKRIQTVSADYQKQYRRMPRVFILENHGLLVSAPNPASAIQLVRKTVSVCAKNLPAAKAVVFKGTQGDLVKQTTLALRRVIFRATGRRVMINRFIDDRIAAFIGDRSAKKLCSVPAVTPDELIYTSGPALWLDNADRMPALERKLTAVAAAGRPMPVGVLIKNLGLFIAASPDKTELLCDVLSSYAAVRRLANRLGGVKSITLAERRSINESIRACETSTGPVAGRIAVVTGAGSGLGRSIAVGLARGGAAVALADIDGAAAEQTARIIAAERPHIPTFVLQCNVTSEPAVIASYDSILKQWGGLDILVNAAGIAPAYPLTELPLEKWRMALDINLTGYFLMAKHAAGIFIAQNIGGSIVNISSKSGLEASRDNTPYNATKAGEIHIARGWAIELGRHNIRVNSVCPGNVFEGSKIWNPEYIKVCAKKYGIKPEEVIPYYISKTALNLEIKGQDIADSVVFLCSDKARRITGQTLVTDAGQVMVR